MVVEERPERRVGKGNNNRTRICCTNLISYNKSTERQTCSECIIRQKYGEKIDHIVSAYPILAEEQYLKRHDRLCDELHFNICKGNGVNLENELWYEHVPILVDTCYGGRETVLWKKTSEN
jgi:hypothetical protein